MFGIDKQYTASFKHSGLVFGIVAVVCLQLGFTTILRTSDLSERSSLIVNNADSRIAPVPVTENVATIHPEDLEVLPGVEEPIRVTHPETKHVSRRAKPEVRPAYVAAAKKRPAPVKIKPSGPADTYAIERKPLKETRKESPEPAFRAYEITVAEASLKPKSEKRSLIASALPIVKKPYGWLKALGSKLF